MPKLTEYELERQANIARNLALLEELNLKEASLVSRKVVEKSKSEVKAKPIQPAKRVKRERSEVVEPRRQSLRLRKEAVDPNESPFKRRKREAEAEARRKREEDERLEAEERARQAKKPRHQDLDLSVLTQGEELSENEISELKACLNGMIRERHPRQIGDMSEFTYDEDKDRESAEVSNLREKLSAMKVISRAKVTQDRIYSAAYHPEKTKDLIFFGDKHGQLGIWDARAPPEEIEDEDGDVHEREDREGGKYWRMQPHWPATSKSSISCIKMDPIDAHNIFTSAYDCTIRRLSFTSGISSEIFSMDDVLISSFDLPPTGNEIWVSDADGGLSHLDLREDKSKARRWYLADQKVGCVSVNPTHPHLLLLSSNDRTAKIWDSRKLLKMPFGTISDSDARTSDLEDVVKYDSSKAGKGTLVAQSPHGKSVSAAYWDPRGRSIVSTCYDDKLRLWDVADELNKGGSFRSFKPFHQIKHNCQTGRWLTVLKAQWTPNPDVYPHFTIGNMDHSLDIFSCKGELLARLSDRQRITAVQAVTCSHPAVAERAVSGNASGRCVLWAPISEA